MSIKHDIKKKQKRNINNRLINNCNKKTTDLIISEPLHYKRIPGVLV